MKRKFRLLDAKMKSDKLPKRFKCSRKTPVLMAQMQAELLRSERLAKEERLATLNLLADSFEQSVQGVVSRVSSAATEMEATAQSMSATAAEASAQSTAVGRRIRAGNGKCYDGRPGHRRIDRFD